MKFTVTEDNIINGEHLDSKQCPVALAIRDVFPRKGEILVSLSYILIGTKYYKTPLKVRKFIDKFDGFILEGRINPFTFELPIDE